MANILVKGVEITVVWHVEDPKVSHKDPFEVTKFDQHLLTVYGNRLTVHRLKIHDYLGTDLDYSWTVLVQVLVIKYLQKVLDKFPEELRGATSTPVTDRLFQVRGEDEA